MPSSNLSSRERAWQANACGLDGVRGPGPGRGKENSPMRRSTERILVSHAGNLPRPAYLDELIEGGRAREGSGRQEYHERLPKAVHEIVDRQIDCGVDIVNDGEYVKAGS